MITRAIQVESRKPFIHNHLSWMHSSFIVFYCMYAVLSIPQGIQSMTGLCISCRVGRDVAMHMCTSSEFYDGLIEQGWNHQTLFQL